MNASGDVSSRRAVTPVRQRLLDFLIDVSEVREPCRPATG